MSACFDAVGLGARPLLVGLTGTQGKASLNPVLADAIPAATFAGVVAVAVTVAVERLGGRLGGLLGTMPSTIVPASLGIYAQSDHVAFTEAMDLVPSGMMLNVLFLLLWRVLPPRLPKASLGATLLSMTVVSLALWSVVAALVVWLGNSWKASGESTLGWAIVPALLMLVMGGLSTRRARPAPKGTMHVSIVVLVCRGLFAALAIGLCVWVASLGNPLAAGVVSVFPAIFLTTMVSVWLSQGRAVQAGAVGPMLLGSLSVAGYALWARVLMPELGAGVGALASWTGAVLTTTVPSWFWLRRSSTG